MNRPRGDARSNRAPRRASPLARTSVRAFPHPLRSPHARRPSVAPQRRKLLAAARRCWPRSPRRGWWWSASAAPRPTKARYRTAPVERGDIRVAISATGTLSAISTVDVGSQISGQVTDVLVDFNDRVQGRPGDRAHRSRAPTRRRSPRARRRSPARAPAWRQRRRRCDNAEADYTRKADLGAAAADRAQRRRPGAAPRATRRARRSTSAQAQIRQQQAASTQTTRLNLHRTRDPLAGRRRGAARARSSRARPWPPACRRRCCSRSPRTCRRWRSCWRSTRPTSARSRPGRPCRFTVDAFPERQFRGKVRAGAAGGDQHQQRDHLSGGGRRSTTRRQRCCRA